MGYDVHHVRSFFPALQGDNPACFLDSGASALKPSCVLKAMADVYEHHYANIHRGLYPFAVETTKRYEEARQKVQRFLGAASHDEIVFVRNATEAINLVAYSYGRSFLEKGDHVLISALEHHANIVPWQLLRDEKGIILDVVDIKDDGSLDMDDFDHKLTSSTKIVAMTQVSNVLGTKTPLKEIIKKAKSVGAVTLVDGSQGIVHDTVDVQELGADFYVFTGHKLYGPTGIGVLYGRYELLEKMPPFMGGGDMIDHVSFDKTTFARPPSRFEAGTPAFVEAIGLGAAIDFVTSLGMAEIKAHEDEVFRHLCQRLQELRGLQGSQKLQGHQELQGIEGFQEVEGVRFLVPFEGKAPIVSFVVDGLHSYDVASLLAEQGVCVRVGHHCAEPLMTRLGVDGSIRASLGVYNTIEDADKMVSALKKTVKMLS